MTPLRQRSFSLAAEQHRSCAILQNTTQKLPFLRGTLSEVLIFRYALFATLFGELLGRDAFGPKGSPGSADQVFSQFTGQHVSTFTVRVFKMLRVVVGGGGSTCAC